MIRPDFCIIGATKSATSWLHLCLVKHPDIEAVSNETYYLTEHFEEGNRYLRKYAAAHTGNRVFGDYSNDYILYHERSIPNMLQLNPEMKVIACLRNPVDRAYSFYRMWFRAAKVGDDLMEAVVPGNRMYDEGFYYHHLQQFITALGRDRVHVVLFDDIKDQPATVAHEVYRFLDVDDAFRPDVLGEAYNNAPKFRPKSVKLHKFFAHAMDNFAHTGSFGRKVKETLRRSPLKKYYHKLNKGVDVPPLTIQQKQYLQNAYREDVSKLSQMLDRDLLDLWGFTTVRSS